VSRTFAAGDRVLLVDNRKRRHLITLEAGGEFHTHAGIVRHDDVIGQDDGAVVRSTRNARLIAVRPTLSEYVLEMPRGAQVIYPKDLGPILMLADVFPGARVLESGVGSGALTTALLRAGGPTGHVTGYGLRDEFAQRAVRNVHGFLGADVPLDVRVRDVYEGIDLIDLDRVVLDLPEPWRVVKHAVASLRPGGILLAYLPTILQVGRLREELDDSASG
jgi:tRNA (adenine57-N1/adenine58-N1)-methyltransferase